MTLSTSQYDENLHKYMSHGIDKKESFRSHPYEAPLAEDNGAHDRINSKREDRNTKMAISRKPTSSSSATCHKKNSNGKPPLFKIKQAGSHRDYPPNPPPVDGEGDPDHHDREHGNDGKPHEIWVGE
jgi:hypothetical protein